ncbi:hypothetical protein [Microcoleus sp. herbarium14]
MKVAPFPSPALSAGTSGLCASTKYRTIDKPSPNPLFDRATTKYA